MNCEKNKGKKPTSRASYDPFRKRLNHMSKLILMVLICNEYQNAKKQLFVT